MSNIKIRELAEEFAKINDLKFVDYFGKDSDEK